MTMTCPLLLMVLSVLSLNCNGIRDQPKHAGLVQWLRSLPVSVDIVCLQETHCLAFSECSLWFQSYGTVVPSLVALYILLVVLFFFGLLCLW